MLPFEFPIMAEVTATQNTDGGFCPSVCIAWICIFLAVVIIILLCVLVFMTGRAEKRQSEEKRKVAEAQCVEEKRNATEAQETDIKQ